MKEEKEEEEKKLTASHIIWTILSPLAIGLVVVIWKLFVEYIQWIWNNPYLNW